MKTFWLSAVFPLVVFHLEKRTNTWEEEKTVKERKTHWKGRVILQVGSGWSWLGAVASDSGSDSGCGAAVEPTAERPSEMILTVVLIFIFYCLGSDVRQTGRKHLSKGWRRRLGWLGWRGELLLRQKGEGSEGGELIGKVAGGGHC